MDVEKFLKLPAEEIAPLVRAAGVRACAFPINGTRRWFMLECEPQSDDSTGSYLDAVVQRHVDLYQMFFDHGLDFLLAPIFGPDLLKRGDEYVQVSVAGLSSIATHPTFLKFYETYDVRIGFYGDYRKFFSSPCYSGLIHQFDRVTEQTRLHTSHRLYFGICANDASETVAELSIRYYHKHGRLPDKHALVEMYYGEYVPPISFFIGFDKFCVFDVPLVTNGDEDLYFTVSPSLYFTSYQLRAVLYDHMYTRRTEETDYSGLSAEAWTAMRSFYRANQNKTLGIGAKHPLGGYWYPLPEVELPQKIV